MYIEDDIIEERGGENVRPNKKGRKCNRNEGSKGKRLDFLQGSSYCERCLRRENEGLAYGADEERENLSMF